MSQSISRFLVSGLMGLGLIVASGCSTKESVQGLPIPQVDSPQGNQPQPPAPPRTEIPASTDLKLGSNALPIKSLDHDTEVFYFNFSKIDAEKVDYSSESTVSSCPGNAPVQAVALVDFGTGTESVVRDLGDSATIEKPAATAMIRVTVSGLAGCFGYGSTFTIEKR